MQYRIQIQIAFDDYDEAHDFYDDILNMIPKANPLPDDNASWHKCYHDEPIPKPCEVIATWSPD